MKWYTDNEYERRFGNMHFHDYRHPLYVDKWNPYWRQCFTPSLDKRVFDGLNYVHDGVHTTPDFCFMGCLDAPEEIPCGSTLNIKTIGEYNREEYNKMPRECDDWKARERAHIKTVIMLKRILKESEEK